MQKRGHRGYIHVNMEKVEEKAKATLPENGVPEEILRDLPFDSHLEKMVIQKQATTVHEPTPNLKKIEDLMNVIVPNAVTMESSSCDTVDSNSMLCNALEQVKAKVRQTESNMTTKEDSFFAALCRGTRDEKINVAEHCILKSIFNTLQTRQDVITYSLSYVLFYVNGRSHGVYAVQSLFSIAMSLLRKPG